jgi:hypothetical protein
MSKTIEEILAPKPEARPRIYAYSIADKVRMRAASVAEEFQVTAADGKKQITNRDTA